MATSFKWSHAGTTALSAPSLQKATTNPRLHWTWLDTHRQVWVSLFWGHCSFLLGPGTQKLLFVPPKSLFPQSYLSSGGSLVGMGFDSKCDFTPPTTLLGLLLCPWGISHSSTAQLPLQENMVLFILKTGREMHFTLKAAAWMS